MKKKSILGLRPKEKKGKMLKGMEKIHKPNLIFGFFNHNEALLFSSIKKNKG
jgi:hypothetical protein